MVFISVEFGCKRSSLQILHVSFACALNSFGLGLKRHLFAEPYQKVPNCNESYHHKEPFILKSLYVRDTLSVNQHINCLVVWKVFVATQQYAGD